MTSWKTYRLGDICDLVAGFAFKSKDFGDYPNKVVKIADIQPPVVNTNELVGVDMSNYDTNKLRKYIVSKGDYVLAMTGATIGKLGRITDDVEAYINQRVLTFRPNESIVDKDYLYYQLYSLNFNKYILNHIDSETAQPNISAGSVGGFEISLPPLAEQRRIAGILGAIDDKIENNRRINTNLELQAQALYKQWFVDFEFPNEEGKPYKSSGGKMVDSELGLIPEGWSVGTLSDLADVTMGQSPNGKSFNENGDGIVFYQGRTEFGVRYPSIRLYTTEPTRYAEPMSVLLSVRAPVGDINIATQRCCIGRGVASIKSKTDDNAYMYCCLKELRPQLDQYNGEGTVFGSINRKELEGLVLCIPKYEIISKFNDVILGTDKQMLNLFQQTQNLATLRDTLLPKLMNGEIKL